MARSLDKLQQWWATATPKQQKAYIIGGTALAILVAAWVAAQFAPKPKPKPADKRVESTVMLPQRKDLSAESLQSQMTSLQNQVRDIMAYLRSVDNNVKTANDNINAKIDQKLEDVVSSKTLQEKIERAVEGKVLETNERNRNSAPPAPPSGAGAAAGGAPGPGTALPNYAPQGPILPGIGPPGTTQSAGESGAAAPGGAAKDGEGGKDDGVGQMRIGGRGAAAGDSKTPGGAPAIGGGPASRTASGSNAPKDGPGLPGQVGIGSGPKGVNPVGNGGVYLGKPGRAFGQGSSTLSGSAAAGGPTDSSLSSTSAANQTDRDQLDDNRGGESIQLTAGAIFSGVLLNGMDAPTSQTAQKNPTPVVIRVKHEAILPNRWKSSAVKECFILAGGYGVMSTERANMRTETLTCILSDGRVFEGKLDGYLVGEDGKVGLRGRLVTKQGAAIANAMIAGILSGIGNAMAQSVTYGTTVATGGFLASTASAQEVLQNGAYQGVGQALNTVAKFYTDMAKEMFPVIEIDAGRFATIVLIKGINLRPKGR